MTANLSWLLRHSKIWTISLLVVDFNDEFEEDTVMDSCMFYLVDGSQAAFFVR